MRSWRKMNLRGKNVVVQGRVTRMIWMMVVVSKTLRTMRATARETPKKEHDGRPSKDDKGSDDNDIVSNHDKEDSKIMRDVLGSGLRVGTPVGSFVSVL